MSEVLFEQIPLGGNRNFGYLLADRRTRVAALVDPAFIPDELVERVRSLNLTLEWVLVTHGHSDHTNGVERVRELVPEVRVAAHPQGYANAEVHFHGGESFRVGDVPVEVLFTPGHHPGSLCFLVDGRKLISGDELFVGKVGGTDFPGSDVKRQHHSLFEVLLKLDDAVEVWPGHNFGAYERSTIGEERRTNPFLQRPSLDDFKWLKDNWAEYKKQHNLP